MDARSAPQGGEEIVVLGRVVGAYGIGGWIKIEPYTEALDAVLEYRSWQIRQPGAGSWRAVEVKEGRPHGASVVARLAGIDDRDAALALKGAEIGIPRAELPEAGPDEMYWADLVGLEVVNREGRLLGTVRGVTEYGAHPVLQVQDASGKSRLIPWVTALVDQVDVAGGRIEVDWGEDY